MSDLRKDCIECSHGRVCLVRHDRVKLGPWRVAPRCIVCNRPIVLHKNTMCGSCGEAYDRFNRRDSTAIGLIRWAAQRARRFARE